MRTALVLVLVAVAGLATACAVTVDSGTLGDGGAAPASSSEGGGSGDAGGHGDAGGSAGGVPWSAYTVPPCGDTADWTIALEEEEVFAVRADGGPTLASSPLPGELRLRTFDASGAPLAERLYAPPDVDGFAPGLVLSAVAAGPDGSTAIAGTLSGAVDLGTGPSAKGASTTFVARYDAALGATFVHALPYTATLYTTLAPGALAFDAAGDLYLAGDQTTTSLGHRRTDGVVARVDETGELVWTTMRERRTVVSIVRAAQGVWALETDRHFKFGVARFDASGAVTDLDVIPDGDPGSSDDANIFPKLAPAPDGGFYLVSVVAKFKPAGGTSRKTTIQRFDANGVSSWSREYRGDLGTTSLNAAENGELVFVGLGLRAQGPGLDFKGEYFNAMLLLDATGSPRCATLDFNRWGDVVLDPTGNIVMVDRKWNSLSRLPSP